MNRVASQTLKEIRQFARDRQTVALAFILPTVSLLMFGLSTRLEARDIPVVALNFDSGKLSRDYIDTLFENQQIKLGPAISQNPIIPLDMGQAKATIVIPPEFSRRIKQNLPAHVQLAIDASDVNNARVIKYGVLATTDYFVRAYGLIHGAPLINLRLRLWFNPGREEKFYIVPGAIALVLWIFPSLLSALAMAREKEQGTILQLFASGITSVELILGKALAYLIVGIAEAAVLILVAMLVFGITYVGNVPFFILSTVLYLLAAALFGQLCGARAATQTAAVQIVATAGFTTAMLLSGFIYPVRNIVFPFSLLSNAVPAYYYIDACRYAFVRGGDATAHWHIPVILAVITGVVLLASSRILAKMQLST
jgi:ABC-2 type transport system permease protein